MIKREISAGYEHLGRFVDDLPRLFDDAGELLHDGRNTVRAFDADGCRLVVKRYRRYNIFQSIAYTLFKPSKAVRAWRYAAMLRSRGIGTPREVAYLETGGGRLKTVGYFVSLRCDDRPVKELLGIGDDGWRMTAGRQYAVDAVAALIAHMHDEGILYGDLNVSNILYHIADDGRCVLSVIDTDRARFKPATPRECADDLKRVTHHREVLKAVVEAYAACRGLDAAAVVGAVMRRLDRFERRNAVKRRLKRVIGRR